MTNRQAVTTVMVVLAVLSVYFFAWQSDETTNTPSQPIGESQLGQLRVGFIPVTHCLPLYVAADRGYFVNEGLDVEMTPLAGGARILEALAAGAIDVGFSNVVSPMLGRAQGFPFVAFTGGPVEDPEHRDHALLVSLDSELQSIADLSGKVVAINTRRNIDHLMLLLLLESHGLEENAITLVEVPFPRMLAALQSGSVDVIAAAEPFIEIGLATSEVRILSWNYTDVRDETFVAAYVTTDETIASREPHLVAFARAISAATDDIRTDPSGVRRILADHTALTPAIATEVRLPRFDAELPLANVTDTYRLARRLGLLNQDVDLSLVFRTLD